MEVEGLRLLINLCPFVGDYKNHLDLLLADMAKGRGPLPNLIGHVDTEEECQSRSTSRTLVIQPQNPATAGSWLLSV